MVGAPVSFHTSPESSQKNQKYHFKSIEKKFILGVFLLLTAFISTVFIMKGGEESFVSLPGPFSEFVGRQELLKEIKHFLLRSKQNELSVVALWGEAGMGKSETAIQFANHCLKKFSMIYWINAGSEEVYQQSYYNLAEELNVKVDKKTPFEGVREKVHIVLENKKFCKPWLLIYDNADKAVLLPQRGNGKIMITTRDKTHWEFAKCIEIPPFSEKDTLELYKKVMDTKMAKEWPILAKELDYYPLAISQALHYVKDRPHFFIADYLSTLEENKNTLLSHANVASRYPKNLLAIWQMNANTIKLTYPHALAWLEICAYLHPDKIPISWLEAWLIFENDMSKEEAKFEASEILRTLSNQGHIRLSQDLEYFSIHRLKQELIKLTQNDEVSIKVLRFLTHLVKDYEFIDSLEWDDRSWNALIDWEASGAWWLFKNGECSEEIEGQIFLLNVMGNIQVIVKGRYKEGIELFQKALDIQKYNHNVTYAERMIYTLLNQGLCFVLLAQYEQVNDLFTTALNLTQKNPTKEYARCLLYLAGFLNGQGESKRAIECGENALELFQSLYGSELNAEICENIKLLGEFWRFVGDYEKAIQFSLRALKINKALFGEKENLQRCYIFITLGAAFRKVREFDLALKCHFEAHRIEKKLFPSDPSIAITIISLREIAIDYCAKGKYAQSLYYTDKGLQIAKEVYPNYLKWSCIDLISNLGNIQLGLGKIDKAICYFNEVLDKLNILSKNAANFRYAIAYRGLGRCYCKQEEFEKGVEFFEKALEIRKKIFCEMPSNLTSVLEDLVFACEKIDPEKATQYRQLLKEAQIHSLSREQRQSFKRAYLEAI